MLLCFLCVQLPNSHTSIQRHKTHNNGTTNTTNKQTKPNKQNKQYSQYDEMRFDFFCRAALEFLLQTGRQPDILHCHDWQTAHVAKAYW